MRVHLQRARVHEGAHTKGIHAPSTGTNMAEGAITGTRTPVGMLCLIKKNCHGWCREKRAGHADQATAPGFRVNRQTDMTKGRTE